MTLEEMRASTKELLTTKDVSEVLHCALYALTQTAREFPERIGFPLELIKSRLKIPRIGFLNWWDAKNAQQEAKRSVEE